jgi:ABC-type Fe3+/spermidine/putrescine transport system ATPase subunit
MTLLELDSVSKSFSGIPVLHDVSFHVSESEIVCLLGPSGCGKTTLLRIIAGLEAADAGHTFFGGRLLDDVPVHHRGFGLMFQDYALFPHKDVEANVAFGLRVQHLTRSQVETRVAEMLDLVGLAGYETRRVYDLSGGEQQRVALARSLAPGPRLLMLDEPLGSLDRALREQLMNELRVILRQVDVTTLYVTHDQQEAFAVADRLIIMNQGRVVQEGTPLAIYRHPTEAWVARFLGLINLVPGRIVSVQEVQAPQPLSLEDWSSLQPAQMVAALYASVDTPLGRLRAWMEGSAPASPVSAGQHVTVLLRPEGARLAGECSDEDHIRLSGIAHECSFRGSQYRLLIDHSSGYTFAFELAATTTGLPEPGEEVALLLHPGAVSVIAEAPSG